MKPDECLRDPKFRREFINHEMVNLKKVVDGNKNLAFHNEAKVSILEEIKKGGLTDTEMDIVEEHLGALMTLSDDLEKQNERLLIMVEIYDKFVNASINSLKLKRG